MLAAGRHSVEEDAGLLAAGKRRMNCFSSADPAAVNASVLYDFQDNDNNLWSRSSHGASLPPCFPTPPADGHQCTVCLHNMVYAVCRSLSSSADVIMEANAKSVSVSKSDCPEAPSDEAPPGQLPTAIAITIAIGVIGFVVFVVLRCRRSSNPRESKEGPEEPGEAVALTVLSESPVQLPPGWQDNNLGVVD